MPRLAAVLRPLLAARLLLFFLFVALVLLVPTASNAHADPHPGPDGEVAGTATEQEPPPVEPAAPDVPAECTPPQAPADTAGTPPPAPPAECAPPEAPADTAAAPPSAPPAECAPPEAAADTPPPPAPPAEPVPVKAPTVASPRSSTPPPPARPSSRAVTVAAGSNAHARRTATATKPLGGHRGDQPRVTPTRRSWPSDTPRESQTHRDGGDTLTNAGGGLVGRASSIGQEDPNLILTLGLIAAVTAILITVLVAWSKLFPGNTA